LITTIRDASKKYGIEYRHLWKIMKQHNVEPVKEVRGARGDIYSMMRVRLRGYCERVVIWTKRTTSYCVNLRQEGSRGALKGVIVMANIKKQDITNSYNDIITHLDEFEAVIKQTREAIQIKMSTNYQKMRQCNYSMKTERD